MIQPDHHILDFENIQITMRSGVAYRHCAYHNFELIYLSIYQDEIDRRLDRFKEGTHQFKTSGIDNHLPDLVISNLELTDSILLIGNKIPVHVFRGGSCNFPLYFNKNGSRIRISTLLSLYKEDTFSKSNLARYMAVNSLQGQHEPNSFIQTPLANWVRLKRGFLTSICFDLRTVESEFSESNYKVDHNPSQDDVINAIRNSFGKFSDSQMHVKSSVLELSGGYDSTITGAAASSGSNQMLGVSVRFPFYEFRFEETLQKLVGSFLGIRHIFIDGRDTFPFSLPKDTPVMDEPSVFITGIRHIEKIAKQGKSNNASKIYVGHGGDLLFASNLNALHSIFHKPTRSFYTKETWKVISNTFKTMHQVSARRLSTGCFIYDGIQDIWVKEKYGALIRTPFTDLEVFRSAMLWTQYCQRNDFVPDKRILEISLQEYIPECLKDRRGKVTYDGVWKRAYSTHGKQIAHSIDRYSSLFEFLGVKPKALLDRLVQLMNWKNSPEEEVIAAYAITEWLSSWEIENISDIHWTD